MSAFSFSIPSEGDEDTQTILKDEDFFEPDSIEPGKMPSLNPEVELEHPGFDGDSDMKKIAIEAFNLGNNIALYKTLERRRNINTGFALESMKKFGSDALLPANHYTAHPSLTNYQVTMENIARKISDGARNLLKRLLAWFKKIGAWIKGDGKETLAQDKSTLETTIKETKTDLEKWAEDVLTKSEDSERAEPEQKSMPKELDIDYEKFMEQYAYIVARFDVISEFIADFRSALSDFKDIKSSESLSKLEAVNARLTELKDRRAEFITQRSEKIKKQALDHIRNHSRDIDGYSRIVIDLEKWVSTKLESNSLLIDINNCQTIVNNALIHIHSQDLKEGVDPQLLNKVLIAATSIEGMLSQDILSIRKIAAALTNWVRAFNQAIKASLNKEA